MMAPLGISIVNLLIESSSLSCFAEGRQPKKGEEFAQNSPILSTSPTPNETSASENLSSSASNQSDFGGKDTFSTSSSSSSFEEANFTNNNNYFSGTSQNKSFSTENNFQASSTTTNSSTSPSQKLYSFFWEKFRACDLEQQPAPYTSPATSEEKASLSQGKNLNWEGDHKSTKLYENLQRINSKLLPLWALLSYPSDLHFYGRVALMTVVTSYVVEKTLQDLPDMDELKKKLGPILKYNVLDGSDPIQPGSSSSGSLKNRISFRGDPLSRRASGDAVVSTSSEFPTASFRSRKGILSHRHHRSFNNYDCGSNIEQSMENNGQNNLMSPALLSPNEPTGSCHSSRQNIFFRGPLEEKSGGGYGAHLTISNPRKIRDDVNGNDCEEGGGDDNRIKRQFSMTLSIPSREDSVRSQSSTNSFSLSTPLPITSAAPLYSNASKYTAGHQVKPSLLRYGSNPDIYRQQVNRAKLSSSRSLVGSSTNIRSPAGSNINLAEKKQQILSQEKEKKEVAWVVHIGFSSLLILAITCIVVFLRLSSNLSPSSNETTYNSSFISPTPSPSMDGNMSSLVNNTVRKENENLLQSIQPPLNTRNNSTTPQPSTHTQQVHDNSNANQDNGNNNDNDKSIASLHSGQSLTRHTLSSSSSSSSDNTPGEEGVDTDTQLSNNETTHESSVKLNLARGESSVVDEGINGSPNRSNNKDDRIISIINSNDSSGSSNTNINPSLKSNSIRPKRSKPRTKSDTEDDPRTSNIIMGVLNEKKHSGGEIENTPGLTKTRHLESTLIRFLKNSGGQGMRRERRYLEGDSRKL